MSETFKKVRYGLVALLLLACTAVQAQSISGNVKDANGEPVIGATIMEQGTQNGTVTDFDGNFTLKLQKGGNINVSYVGMKSQVIKTAGKSSVNVTLEDDNTTLNDIVVVGYGTMKKSDLTGSVSSVNTEQLNAKGAASVMENLQGANPGVNITMSGRVGDSPTIEIRGKSSLNPDVQPLYVVDGVFCDDIDWLNPQDIEKIDILKDASSTAIYGSRATAGVVMVTTKSGATVAKEQKPTVSYDGYIGWVKAVRMPDFMNAQQYKDYRFQKYLVSTGVGNNPEYYMTGDTNGYDGAMVLRTNGTKDYALVDMLNEGVNVDWPDVITRGGTQQNHYLAVSGTGKGIAYNFGLGYNAEKGVYVGDESKKTNFKGSVDAEINKYFKAGFTFNASYQTLSQANSDAIKNAYMMTPFCKPYDADGTIALQPGYVENFGSADTGINFTKTYNPLLSTMNNTNDKTTWRLLGNAYLQFEPMKGLVFKTTYSPSYRHITQGDYTGFINPKTGDYYDVNDGVLNGYAYLANSTTFAYTWDNTVNFNKRFAEKHNVGFMGLYSVQRSYTEYQRTGASGLDENILWNNLNAGTILGKYDSTDSTLKNYGLRNYYDSNSMISWAARLNYGYMDRYLLTATVRWDGSSRFADGNRWGCFPSVAVAWRMSEEEFIKKIDWISNLKLRLSYGVTGNCDGIGSYATLANRSEGTNYTFGSTTATGYTTAKILDQNLKWEKSHEWNFGVDFGFLNGRINGSIDLYSKKSKDLLYDVQLPLEAGGGQMTTNIGSVRNSGVEISLTTVNIKNKNWEWTTTFNFSHNKNEVKEINGIDNILPNGLNGYPGDETGIFIGRSVNNVYGYDWTGIVTDRMMNLNEAQMNLYRNKGGVLEAGSIHEYDFYGTVYGWKEGAPILADVNCDGAINDADLRVWSSDPVWTGSFSTSLTYKNWDFGMSWYAKVNYKAKSGFLEKYGAQDQRGQGRLNVDYYIPAGTLLSCDGVNADGTYINPVYQETTHYGDYPIAAGGAQAWGGHYDTDVKAAMSYVNGTYVKCKNITLGYTFPKKWLTPWGCQHLRLYFNVTNPFVISGFKGFDPEWCQNSYSRDVPSTVTYQIGASIKF